MAFLEPWISLVCAIVIGIIAVLLKVLGIFDVFAFFSKWLELRNREKRIEDLEELDKIRKKNLNNISQLIEFKIIIFRHHLDAAAPKVDLQFIIHNSSIFELKLDRFTYKPTLEGIQGGSLEIKEGPPGLTIPSQGSIYFNTLFEIPKNFIDQLYEWREKSKEGAHGSLTWNFGCRGFFVVPKEFQLPMNVQCHLEYYKI